MYNVDRLNANQKYLEKSLRNYQITDDIANKLGFPSQLTQYYFSFCRFLPQINFQIAMNAAEKMRLIAMKGLFRPSKIDPKLDLFFDDFDFRVQRLSSSLPKIIDSVREDKIYDVWVDNSLEDKDITEIFGKI